MRAGFSTVQPTADPQRFFVENLGIDHCGATLRVYTPEFDREEFTQVITIYLNELGSGEVSDWGKERYSFTR